MYFKCTKSSPSMEEQRIVASTSSPVWRRLYSTYRQVANRESVCCVIEVLWGSPCTVRALRATFTLGARYFYKDQEDASVI